MATIANNQSQNPNDNNDLNQSGGPTSEQPTQLSNVGSNAATPAAAQKPATSGQYTNFNNYMQANQNSGQRLSNLLSSNVQQQGQAVKNTTDTSQDVTTAIGAENKRISDDLGKVQGAVQNGQNGDYSGFNQFLDYSQNNTPQGGATTTAQAGQAAQPNTNPTYAGLNNNIQQLVSGQTQGAALGQQANNIFNTAQNQLAGVQTNQSLGQTESGRQQLLQNMLGQGGTYGQGNNLLDQALISGNNGNLSNLLNTLNSTTQNAQNSLGNAQTAVGTGLTGLQQNATAAQQQLPGLANQGLSTLDTQLGTAATTAEQQRQQQQLGILNQLNTQNFNQDTANQLGIGDQTTLFNILKGNGQNYNITDAANLGQFANNNPYLSLNQAQVNKSNVINNPQLQGYSALQKMLGTSPEAMAYNQAGTVDPSYNLNAKQFDTDLGAKYQAAADAANKDTIGGYGEQHFHHGLFNMTDDVARANVSKAVNQMVDPNAILAAAKNFSALGQPSQDQTPGNMQAGQFRDVSNVSQALGNISLGRTAANAGAGFASGGPVGAIVGAAGSLVPAVGAAINSLTDSLGNNNNMATSQQNANDAAMANFKQNWQNYLNSKGYTDVAHVGPQDMEQNKNFNVS